MWSAGYDVSATLLPPIPTWHWALLYWPALLSLPYQPAYRGAWSGTACCTGPPWITLRTHSSFLAVPARPVVNRYLPSIPPSPSPPHLRVERKLETYGLGTWRLKLDQFGKSRAFSTQYEKIAPLEPVWIFSSSFSGRLKLRTPLTPPPPHIWNALLQQDNSLDLDNEEFGSPPPEFLDPNANVANDNDSYRWLDIT